MYLYRINVRLKNIDLNKFIIFFFLIFSISNLVFAQDDVSFELTYEVNRVYKPLAISAESMDTAKTIADLNPHFKPSWVKEYKSVDISTNHNGKTKIATTKSEVLSQDQLDNMAQVDLGSEITVAVQYMPDNNLRHNDIQEEKFKITVDPVKEASFPGGHAQLNQYISKKIKRTVSKSDIDIYNVKAIQFSITEEGQVVDAHIPEDLFLYQDKEDKIVDNFLFDVICNMPTWSPAEYADGTKVKQDFVLTIGDHRSCTLNLLNIRRDFE